MHPERFWHPRLALAAAIAVAAAVFLLVADSAAAKERNVDYLDDVHLADSRKDSLLHGEEKVGRIKLIDIFIAPSKEKFRNKPGAPRKRVYRVRGTLSIRPKPGSGYQVGSASCAMGAPQGSFALTSLKNNSRLFFPRSRSNLETVNSPGSIKAGIFGAEVTLPFPLITYHVEQDAIAVDSTAITSKRHKWSWNTGDPRPPAESFGFAGHWAASARGIEVSFLCKAIAIGDPNIFGSAPVAFAKLRVHRELRP